jgi:polynucleotide 5'-hydroxyl-kinase GRC3/NOL9
MKGQPKVYKRLEIIPEPEWERLVEELIINNKGPSIIMGATSSGKSTLARYLIEMLLSKNRVISLIDSDIGQSSLGLPGTITMKVFKKTEDIKDFSADKIFFIGSLNPAKKIPLMIEGNKKLVDIARVESEIVLVDTTGLITGEAAKALKIGKIKALKPDHLIVIQRRNELEHLITLTGGIDIHRIKASKMARGRNREARMRYRRERFFEYFNEKKVTKFLLYDVDLIYNNQLIIPKKRDFKEGTLIALNHNNETKDLGLLLELDNNSITFISPIKSVREINRVVLGDINIEDSLRSCRSGS